MRVYTATELVRELAGVGFDHVDVWGDFDGATPLSPETRLVIRAAKAADRPTAPSPARGRGG